MVGKFFDEMRCIFGCDNIVVSLNIMCVMYVIEKILDGVGMVFVKVMIKIFCEWIRL